MGYTLSIKLTGTRDTSILPIYTDLKEIDCIGCTLTFHRPLVQFVRDARRESLGALCVPDVAQLLDEV